KLALQYVSILKANEFEMEVLTGSADVKKSARILFEWGVREIVITLGSRGSVIYDGLRFYHVPAYSPVISVVDATGCGDTYMSGYLYQRFKGAGLQKAGEFAAAMATLKIESSGPFMGSENDVCSFLATAKERAVFGM
ncbi:MAG: ribokinase, partial [Bacteroidetes bacterium]|nr:ribokinase [Bacteroidota bacterium]